MDDKPSKGEHRTNAVSDDSGANARLWNTVFVALADMLCWPLAEFFTLTVEELPYLQWQVLEVTLLGMGYQLLVGIATGLYRRRWLPFSFEEVGVASLTTGIAGLLVVLTGYALHGHPRGPVVWFTASVGMAVLAVRYARRLSARWRRSALAKSRTPLVVVGAGEGGARAIRAMLNSTDGPYRPVALLDDDPASAHRRIMGVRVRGTTTDLAGQEIVIVGFFVRIKRVNNPRFQIRASLCGRKSPEPHCRQPCVGFKAGSIRARENHLQGFFGNRRPDRF
ncbi:MAG TPA: hypothetical protein PLV13_02795 [Ilumatobacteraceae bacterium]|nr:hypothetical protein [Ilumatobacteraceae bacterium]